MADTMKIEIEEDGTISIQTSEISGKNHVSADEFVALIEEMGGGERSTKARKQPYSMALKSRDRKVTTFQK
jgi:hypothetical protein